jgi:MoaA/NifB/PqqE/SkfB family radical SAM enzyme
MKPAAGRPVPPSLSLMITRRCNMTCAHCSVASGPDVRQEPSEAELLSVMRQAAALGVRGVNITGGEPMLRGALVVRLIRECRRLGMATVMTTNGFWGRTAASARRHVRALCRAGLGGLTVSYDRYHAAFMGPEPVEHIAQAADTRRLTMNVNVVRTRDDADLASLTARVQRFPRVHLRLYDVQPVGRAADFPAESMRGESEGFCNACANPAVTDDGRLVACNGPSYFAPEGSPLVLGSLRDHDLATLVERHRTDPILDTIRTLGPGHLRDELGRLPGFESFPFRTRYRGLCDLCHHITSSPDAARALRTHLATSSHAALRQATQRVIDASRRAGVLNRRYANGAGACRVLLEAASQGRPPDDASRIFGRADIDWIRLAEYVAACGLARPLVGAVAATGLARWAPAPFVDRLREQALRDGLREILQREALDRIAEVLAVHRTRGVLLKGNALVFRPPADGGPSVPRAATDLDIHLDPRVAPTVRRDLLGAGFAGDAGAGPTAPQHLAPLTYRGALVEIHTRLVAPFWGLPEREMLAGATPADDRLPFDVLGPEGQILHAVIHTAQDSFALGLKTAWDVAWIVRSAPQVDWDLLTAWVRGTRVPRAFWAPMRVLAEDLSLAVDPAFLAGAPTDARQRRLETIARRRLFRAAERPDELDALSRQGVRYLMHDSWPGFLRYLLAQATTRGRRGGLWRGTAQRSLRSRGLGDALEHWRQYRRAVSELDDTAALRAD